MSVRLATIWGSAQAEYLDLIEIMILTTTLPLALFAALSSNGANEPERTTQPIQDQEPAWHGKADLG